MGSRRRVYASMAGVLLGVLGLAAIAYGLSVLADYSHGEHDAPAGLIVGGVVVLFLAPGILAILGAGHLFNRGRS